MLKAQTATARRTEFEQKAQWLCLKHTPLQRSKFFSRQLGCHVFVKDESQVNPTGTMKDRRSAGFSARAKAEGYDAVAVITSGNSGYSLGNFAVLRGLRAFSIVDPSLDPRIALRLAEVSAVISTNLSAKPLSPDSITALVRDKTGFTGKILDSSNEDLFVDGYAMLCSDIFTQTELSPVGLRPTHIIVPVGSGELFASMDTQLSEFESDAKLIGVTVQNNPLSALARPEDRPASPPPASGSYADKLSASFVPFEKIVRMSMLGTGYHTSNFLQKWAVSHSESEVSISQTAYSPNRRMLVASEDAIREMYAFLTKKLRLAVEPTSTAAFTALEKLKGTVSKRDVVVVVNSGRGLHFD